MKFLTILLVTTSVYANFTLNELFDLGTSLTGNFVENFETISRHNAKPNKTFNMTLNHFAFMTPEEFGRRFLRPLEYKEKPRQPQRQLTQQKSCESQKSYGPQKSCKTQPNSQNPSKTPPLGPTFPDSLDWTESGAVTPVKDQGSCGSCWAFSAVAAIESAYFLKTHTLKQFSEQQLVSCDKRDSGCSGGIMTSAMNWTISNGGLCYEQDYKYVSGHTQVNEECATNCKVDVHSRPVKIVEVDPNEDALMEALVNHGPLSVAIEADQSAFQFYGGGVITGMCGKRLNHGVLLVGYGHDTQTDLDYWKIKNSWSENWGMKGYALIQRHKKYTPAGECGINLMASYPVL